MFGTRIVIGRRSKDEGEKPFWISFADLMSALMVLFLLVMSVALLAVTKTVSEADRKKVEREQEIEQLLSKIEKATRNDPDFTGITIDKDRKVVEFGNQAQFEYKKSTLAAPQVKLLRKFVADVVLKYASDDLGKKWFKQIIVEGFTDRQGSYLYNLNLSLDRSQRVLCALLAPFQDVPKILSDKELEQVRDLFFVGGYSFNDSKKTDEESRRIELRLEFFGVDEKHPKLEGISSGNFGDCKI
jgi:outer membrane protein OmpA-like peptidoglycan-associated protein